MVPVPFVVPIMIHKKKNQQTDQTHEGKDAQGKDEFAAFFHRITSLNAGPARAFLKIEQITQEGFTLLLFSLKTVPYLKKSRLGIGVSQIGPYGCEGIFD